MNKLIAAIGAMFVFIVGLLKYKNMRLEKSILDDKLKTIETANKVTKATDKALNEATQEQANEINKVINYPDYSLLDRQLHDDD